MQPVMQNICFYQELFAIKPNLLKKNSSKWDPEDGVNQNCKKIYTGMFFKSIQVIDI